jgi:hypothetical protein
VPTRLTDTTPGSDIRPMPAEGPYKFTASSRGWFTSIKGMIAGSSALTFSSTELPETDQSLLLGGSSLEVVSPQHLSPPGANPTKTIGPTGLVITKTTNSDYDTGVYEETAPTASPTNQDLTPSSGLYVKFVIDPGSAWARINSPAWAPGQSQVVGAYFQLEIGALNTAVQVIFHDDGALGQILLAGPITSGGSMPVTTLSAPWKYAAGEECQLWVAYSPFNPAGPSFDVFFGADTQIQFAGSVLISALGTFPAYGTSNVRSGPGFYIRGSFGNAGHNGDVLTVTDWALLPIMLYVYQGPFNAQFSATPEVPLQFQASGNVLPENLELGSWVLSTADAADFGYAPGIFKTPATVSLTRESTSELGYSRDVTALDTNDTSQNLTYGALLEATISVAFGVADGVSLGCGLELRDGQLLYRLGLVTEPLGPGAGLLMLTQEPQDLTNYSAVLADFSSLRSIRLTTDRLRDRMEMFIDSFESASLSMPLSDAPLAPTTEPRAFLGHFDSEETTATIQLGRFLLVAPYFAWEGLADGILPSSPSMDPRSRFAASLSGSSLSYDSSGSLVVSTPAAQSGYYFHQDPRFSHQDSTLGAFLEFRTQVSTWQNSSGIRGLGYAGPTVFLRTGAGELRIGFVETGLFGRKIYVQAFGAELSDLLQQTQLGQAVSADCDWTAAHAYRVLYTEQSTIQIFIDDFDTPVLTLVVSQALANAGGFSLPSFTGPDGIGFGVQSAAGVEAVHVWSYFRWGFSTGTTLGVLGTYPDSPEWLVGGRAFLSVSATDDTTGLGLLTLTSGAYEPFDLANGSTLTLTDVEHSTTTTITFAGVAAQLSGTTGAAITSPVSANLVLSVNGDRPQTATVVAYGYVDMANQLRDQISGATFVGNDSAHTLVITTLVDSASASLTASGGLATLLGISTATGTGTSGIANLSNAGAAEIASVIDSTFTHLSASNRGGQVTIGPTAVQCPHASPNTANTQLQFPVV